MLIHVGAVDEGVFDCVTEKVCEMGLVWSVLTRGEEQYLLISPPGEHPALSRPELHAWYRQR
ncbi:hypothetical protein E2P65_03925 [Candidatus Bathyarchaeota archaeon]|nr:hypothetical protein E2P65_03925 [Candidatus Bathyarchaeota archaeon]